MKLDLKMMGFREDYDPLNRFDLKTRVKLNDKEYLVSTIDLGIDHSFGFGKPLYYETMIFLENGGYKDNEYANFQRRYATEEEACRNHEKIVNLLKEGKL